MVSQKGFKKIILLVIPLFLTFQVLHNLYSKKVRFDAIPSGIEAILLLAFILYYFYEDLMKSVKQSLLDRYEFWVCIGIMIYLAGTFFFYILANTMSRENVDQYWFITYIIEVIKNVLIAIGLLLYLVRFDKSPQKKKDVPNLDFTI